MSVQERGSIIDELQFLLNQELVTRVEYVPINNECVCLPKTIAVTAIFDLPAGPML